jgi:hypothetical protein
MCLLFLGPAGCGKTTQARLAAERFTLLYAEYDKQSKQPFLELRKIVEQNFGSAVKERRYRGLALDRFIVAGEYDAHYLQWALSAAPDAVVPHAFYLMMSPSAAHRQLDGAMQTLDDHRIQFDAVERIYRPLERLDRIDVEGYSPQAVSQLVCALAEGNDAAKAPRDLPPAYLNDNLVTARLVADVDLYSRVVEDVWNALKIDGPRPVASQIGGFIDASTFENKTMRRNLTLYHATLKADGVRLILVKHSRGVFGFPQSMNAAFNCASPLAAFEWPAAPEPPSSPVDVVFDCELVRTKKPVPTIYVFDYLFMYGARGLKEMFTPLTPGSTAPHRLRRLVEFFDRAASVGTPQTQSLVQLKKYVPIAQIDELGYRSAPFAIDGIVFQKPQEYTIGADKSILKWKPRSHCTVDFRLHEGQEPTGKADSWAFRALVCNEKGEEVPFGDIRIEASSEEVEALNLSDGSIAECIPVSDDNVVWKVLRLRKDKLNPNKHEIATRILSMRHLTYDDLVERILRISKR